MCQQHEANRRNECWMLRCRNRKSSQSYYSSSWRLNVAEWMNRVPQKRQVLLFLHYYYIWALRGIEEKKERKIISKRNKCNGETVLLKYFSYSNDSEAFVPDIKVMRLIRVLKQIVELHTFPLFLNIFFFYFHFCHCQCRFSSQMSFDVRWALVTVFHTIYGYR